MAEYDFGEDAQLVDPKNPRSSAPQSAIVNNFHKALNEFITEEWIKMTALMREGGPDLGPDPEEEEIFLTHLNMRIAGLNPSSTNPPIEEEGFW